MGVESLTRLVERRLAAVSLKMPDVSPNPESIKGYGAIRSLASPLAAWGELTHRYIINIARDIAVRRSRSPDDPAMLTIIVCLVLILLSYVIQFAVVMALLGPWWASAYILSLAIGAYWAAYVNHRTVFS
jgi:hypothetical protein